MVDLIFLEVALAAVATTSGAQTVRRVANKIVNGSLTAALVSVALTAWFLFWPPV